MSPRLTAEVSAGGALVVVVKTDGSLLNEANAYLTPQEARDLARDIRMALRDMAVMKA